MDKAWAKTNLLNQDPAKFLPVVLREYKKGQLAIIDGSHRVWAARQKGLKTIQAYVGKI